MDVEKIHKGTVKILTENYKHTNARTYEPI